MNTLAVAATAAALSGAAYLDAKFALRKDIREILIGRKAIQLYLEAGKYPSLASNLTS